MPQWTWLNLVTVFVKLIPISKIDGTTVIGPTIFTKSPTRPVSPNDMCIKPAANKLPCNWKYIIIYHVIRFIIYRHWFLSKWQKRMKLFLIKQTYRIFSMLNLFGGVYLQFFYVLIIIYNNTKEKYEFLLTLLAFYNLKKN